MDNSASKFLQTSYIKKLFDLGDLSHEEYRGIYSPQYNNTYINNRLNDQFTSGAEYYAKTYTNHAMYRNLLLEGFSIGGLNIDDVGAVLDIGSGAGNSVIPLIEICPTAKIIASDLSVELLRLLGNLISDKYSKNDVALVQLDAENLDFSPNSFDVVCGAAILHHLFCPEKTIIGAGKILKKGGVALFTEPMQSVNFIVRMLYSIILKDPRSQQLPERLQKYINLRIKFFDDRVAIDKSHPRFLKMDDKWMFPKRYLMDTAEKAGFSDFHIKPMGNPKARIRTKINSHMVVGFGIQMSELPDWIIDIIDEFDSQLPEYMAREDIIAESLIVLVK